MKPASRAAIDSSIAVSDLLKSNNWTNTVYITTNNLLETPPQVSSSLTSPWIILSNNKEIRYGTLETISGGYKISKGVNDTKWNSSNTISVSTSPVTITDDFLGARITGVQSHANFTVTKTSGGDFTVTDSEAGASVTKATEINQTAGLFIPAADQSIAAGGHTFAWKTNTGAAMTVTVASGSATINGLNNTDTFTIDENSFEVIDNGLLKKNGTLLWQNGNIGTAVSLTELANDANWYDTIQNNPSEIFDDTSAPKVTLGSDIVIGDASARTKAITIVGNGLDNTILGGKANDAITGGSGDDSIFGDKGADKLYGQSGNDTLWGGTGNDTLLGSAGADVFLYDTDEGKDLIKGFDNSDMLLITGAFSAAYDATTKSIAFKVDSMEDAIIIKSARAT